MRRELSSGWREVKMDGKKMEGGEKVATEGGWGWSC